MNPLCYNLSQEVREQLLHHLRAAVFFQIEMFNATSSMRDTLNAYQAGDWDTELRVKDLRVPFGDRIVTDEDVEIFLAELWNHDGPEDRPFRASLDLRTKLILKRKLQKALWTQNELWKAAALMAQALSEPTEDFVADVEEISVVADTGCELVEADLDFFLGVAPPGTVKRGLPLYS